MPPGLLAHPRLPPPRMNHVGVNIVPPRKLRNAEASRQALRNEPQLLGRCPAPPPLTTRKHRNARHVCPLTCQLTGTRSHAREARGRRSRPDAYGWKGYDDLQMLGYTHEPLVLDGDPERTEAHLPMIHIAFSNLKTWLLGTHHGVSRHHVHAYLNEFVFRFNRRFYPMTAFNSALGLAAHASAPTYKNLYSGDWTHPAT